MRRNRQKGRSERPGKSQGSDIIGAKTGKLSGEGENNGEVGRNICIGSGNGAVTGVFGKFVLIWINQRGRIVFPPLRICFYYSKNSLKNC